MSTQQLFRRKNSQDTPEAMGKKIHDQWVKHRQADLERRSKQDREVC
ncbi:MAG: hypothetical protein H6R19_3205 [Proteobacteria bacterium]|nr:hypothetical protein [Pseudomonadota bacterium]